MTASHTQAASGTLGKANMFLMTKEATDKDQTLKTQMLLSTSVAAPEKISGEPVWKKSGYFKKKTATKEPTSILKNEIFQRILSATSTRGTSPQLREVNWLCTRTFTSLVSCLSLRINPKI